MSVHPPATTPLRWYGNAGHYICADFCRFHLCTEVNGHLVSTVGEYVPEASTREIEAESRGIQLEGRGSARLADFLNKVGYIEVGLGRLYETMVFRLNGERCCTDECANCGLPRHDGRALFMKPYNSAGEAARGHMEAVRQFSDPGEDPVLALEVAVAALTRIANGGPALDTANEALLQILGRLP